MRTLADLFGHAQPWFAGAACATAGCPEAWYPAADNDSRQEYLYAKTICGTCPVRVDCLEYALENRERYGMWGQATPADRARILRQRGADPIPGLRGVA